MADSTSALPKGIIGYGKPMQPLSSRLGKVLRVVKTPLFSLSHLSPGGAILSPLSRYISIAFLASLTRNLPFSRSNFLTYPILKL